MNSGLLLRPVLATCICTKFRLNERDFAYRVDLNLLIQVIQSRPYKTK